MDERSSAHSEQTAREIDEEIRRIIDEAIGKVRHILEQRYDALIALTKRLIEIESVDAEELKRVVEENSRGPLVVPGTGSKVASLRPSLESGDSGAEKAV
jgi:cell division protease FtsH